jgi:nitrogen-specific signal transduction histidine kinase
LAIIFCVAAGAFMLGKHMQARKEMKSLTQSEKIAAAGRTASRLAHDFNNTIGAIMGFASFLQESLPEGSEQHEFATRILAQTNRSNDLIEQIRGIARACEVSDDRPG